MHADQPKRSAIVAALGEPITTHQTVIQGHDAVEVLFFDPEIIRKRILDEGRKMASRLFPSFNCSS